MDYVSMHELRVVEPYQAGEVLPEDCKKEAVGLGVVPDEKSFSVDYRIRSTENDENIAY